MKIEKIFDTDVGRLKIACGFSSLRSTHQPSILQLMPEPKLPSGMAVEYFSVFLTELEVIEEVTDFILDIRLLDIDTDSSSNTGQYLDAIEWSDGSRNITLGTEDLERLSQRAAWVPVEVGKPIVQFKSDGMQLVLSTLPAKTEFSFHFALAVSSGIENETADWFAAGIDHSDILQSKFE